MVVVGEALVDLVGERDGRVYHARPGGSPANVALGLARLNAPATLVTTFGGDPFGRMLHDHLAGGGVPLDVRPARHTSLAIVSFEPGSAPAYDFRIEWDPGPIEHPAQAVHTGSLAAALMPGARHVEAAMRHASRVSYDPNIRPALLGEPEAERARVERQVAMSDVVKVSDEDLAWLYPGRDPLDVARGWRGSGPALVVLTLGARGCAALTESEVVHAPAAATTVVDTVGAGDAFMAALLHGFDHELPLDRTLARANLAAVITCGRRGADPPTAAELEAAEDGTPGARRA